MKIARRVFNFNLPDDLREYIRIEADIKKTTISHYIISLIVRDKEAKQRTKNQEVNLVKEVIKELGSLKNKITDTELDCLIKKEIQTIKKEEKVL